LCSFGRSVFGRTFVVGLVTRSFIGGGAPRDAISRASYSPGGGTPATTRDGGNQCAAAVRARA